MDPDNDEEDPSGAGWRPPPVESDESGTANPRPPPAVPTGPPAEPDGSPEAASAVTGEARGVTQRVEHAEQVWTLRVERHDRHGNRLQPVAVEMRGERFDGSVSDGDWIEVTGRWREGTLVADRVANVTTGGSLHTRRWSPVYLVVVAAVLALAVGVLAVGVIVTREVLSVRQDVRGQIEQQQERDGDFQQRLDDVRREVEGDR